MCSVLFRAPRVERAKVPVRAAQRRPGTLSLWKLFLLSDNQVCLLCVPFVFLLGDFACFIVPARRRANWKQMSVRWTRNSSVWKTSRMPSKQRIVRSIMWIHASHRYKTGHYVGANTMPNPSALASVRTVSLCVFFQHLICLHIFVLSGSGGHAIRIWHGPELIRKCEVAAQ